MRFCADEDPKITACSSRCAAEYFHHSPIMKRSFSLIALLFALIAAPAIRAEEKSGGAGEDSDLHDSMEAMNGSFRKLRRQVADPAQNEASLALVEKLSKAAKEAANDLPELISKLPADAQEAAKTSYTEKMKELSATIDELGAALKAGKNDEAVKIVEELRLQQEAGHREFRPKKQKKEAVSK
jgi:soluble cytochrome b562